MGNWSHTTSPGDQVLVDPQACAKAGPREGDIVIARHPYRTDVWLVKRVVGVLDDGRCLLAGDNPEESTDSRLFGAMPRSYILGRVVFRLPIRELREAAIVIGVSRLARAIALRGFV